MKRYFKTTYPRSDGTAVTITEFDGDRATRQVDIVGERWFCSALAEHFPGIGDALPDQPLSALDVEPEDEITASEFEAVWEEALRRGEQ